MELLVVKNIVPNSGYVFYERDGAKLEGTSWQDLVKVVAEYRKRAGFPAGSPAVEIIQQACKREPWLCSTTDVSRVESPQLARIAALEQLRRGREEFRDKAELVPEVTSLQRVQTCSKCPKLLMAELEGCWSCRHQTITTMQDLVGRRAPSGSVLPSCSAIGAPVGVLACFQEDFLRQTFQQRVDQLPDTCWFALTKNEKC